MTGGQTILHIRSQDAVATQGSGAFQVMMPSTLKGVTQITLIDSTFPSSFLAWSGGTLIIDGTSYQIPGGNYSAGTLQTALTTILTGLSATISYNLSTNVFQIQTPGAHTISASGTANAALGLSTTSALSVPANTLVNFPNAVDLFHVREAFLRLDPLGGLFQSTSGASAHFRLPITFGANSVQFYNAGVSVYNTIKLSTPTDISYLWVSVADNSGAALNFRGGSFTLTLVFQ